MLVNVIWKCSCQIGVVQMTSQSQITTGSFNAGQFTISQNQISVAYSMYSLTDLVFLHRSYIPLYTFILKHILKYVNLEFA